MNNQTCKLVLFHSFGQFTTQLTNFSSKFLLGFERSESFRNRNSFLLIGFICAFLPMCNLAHGEATLDQESMLDGPEGYHQITGSIHQITAC